MICLNKIWAGLELQSLGPYVVIGPTTSYRIKLHPWRHSIASWSTRLALAPERWREYCLASVTTHDLPPTAGYLAGDHVRLRNDLGLLTRSLDEELEADRLEQTAILACRFVPLLGAHAWSLEEFNELPEEK